MVAEVVRLVGGLAGGVQQVQVDVLERVEAVLRVDQEGGGVGDVVGIEHPVDVFGRETHAVRKPQGTLSTAVHEEQAHEESSVGPARQLVPRRIHFSTDSLGRLRKVMRQSRECSGGGAGNRTRVRPGSFRSSTCVAALSLLGPGASCGTAPGGPVTV